MQGCVQPSLFPGRIKAVIPFDDLCDFICSAVTVPLFPIFVALPCILTPNEPRQGAMELISFAPAGALTYRIPNRGSLCSLLTIIFRRSTAKKLCGIRPT
jgi:hypothetical protein